jgi:triosephosphate isomerase
VLEDVEMVAKTIRNQVSHLFGSKTASKIRVLYGGSVTTNNANGFLKVRGIDGLLIGGDSLDAHAFSEIVNKAQAD